MEIRALLTTFTVNNINDSGLGSLRQAIMDSNNNPAPTGQSNLIDFEIGSGTQVIHPASALPTITSTVAIDSTVSAFGSDQFVEIEGDQAGSDVDGLTIDGTGIVINGLAIAQFSGSGIEISGGGENLIESCLIGAGVEGTGNGSSGIDLESPFNTVTESDISGNMGTGLLVNSPNNSVTESTIYDNGADGIVLVSSGNTVDSITMESNTGDGIDVLAYGNSVNQCTIENNTGNGIELEDSGNTVNQTVVQDNVGDGINLFGPNNTITSSTIERNTEDGIDMDSPDNTVNQSTIDSNGNIGLSINNASDNTIGPGNSISDNKSVGLYLTGNQATGTRFSVIPSMET